MATQACNPGTWEAEAELLQVQDQAKQHSEAPVSKEKKQKIII